MKGNPPDLPSTGAKRHKKPMELIEVPVKMVPSEIKSNCAPFEEDTYGEGRHVLYIIPEAYYEFSEYVKYGRKRACNANEQQYIGLGHNFVDSNRSIYTVVTRIIPIYSASSGPTHAKAVSEENDTALDALEKERGIQNQLETMYNTDENGYTIDPFLNYGPSRVVLFGHTHPDLGCFFSSVDHRSNYSSPTFPIVTFVCDPIRKDMKAMVGVDCEPMKIVACRPQAPTSVAAVQRTPSLGECSIADLWQQTSFIVNMLLQQAGVNGSFDCRHDRRGRTHMQFHIVHQPSRKQCRR